MWWPNHKHTVKCDGRLKNTLSLKFRTQKQGLNFGNIHGENSPCYSEKWFVFLRQLGQSTLLRATVILLVIYRRYWNDSGPKGPLKLNSSICFVQDYLPNLNQIWTTNWSFCLFRNCIRREKCLLATVDICTSWQTVRGGDGAAMPRARASNPPQFSLRSSFPQIDSDRDDSKAWYV